MTRRDISYKVYKICLRNTFKDMSDSDIIKFAENCGVRVYHRPDGSNARRASEKIADKALYEGTVPLCYDDACRELKIGLDNRLKREGLIPVEEFRRKLTVYLSNLDRDEIKEFGYSYYVYGLSQSTDCIISKICTMVTNMYSSGYFDNLVNIVSGIEVDLPFMDCETREDFVSKAKEEFSKISVATLTDVATRYGYIIYDVPAELAVDVLVERMANDRFGYVNDDDVQEKYLNMSLCIQVRDSSDAADMIKEIKNVICRHRVVSMKYMES